MHDFENKVNQLRQQCRNLTADQIWQRELEIKCRLKNLHEELAEIEVEFKKFSMSDANVRRENDRKFMEVDSQIDWLMIEQNFLKHPLECCQPQHS